MNAWTAAAGALGLGLAVTTAAAADPVAYTLTGVASGTVAAETFTDQPFSLTFESDPSVDIASFGLVANEAKFNVGGVSAQFSNGVYFGEINGGIYFSGRNGTSFPRDFLDFGLPNGDFVDIYGPFGPVAGLNPKLDQFSAIPTSQGALTLTSAASLSFVGTPYTSAAPEPGTWALMALGVGLAGFALRRRVDASVRLA